jgi:hypothetical protein
VSIDYTYEASVVEGKPTLKQLDDVIAAPMEKKPDLKYLAALGVTTTMLLIGAVSLGLSFYYGTGLWGNNNPVGWALPIVNFVFWVGIGHAGTSDFCYTIPFPPEMEKRYCQICRRYDDFRSYYGTYISVDPHGTPVDSTLAVAYSKCQPLMGEFHFATAVGRVCGFDLFCSIICFLVCWLDS